jgi:hypothetical protein
MQQYGLGSCGAIGFTIPPTFAPILFSFGFISGRSCAPSTVDYFFSPQNLDFDLF